MRRSKMLIKICVLFVTITIASPAKVQLSCHDKSKYCVEEAKEEVCSSDLSRLVCKRTCDRCRCDDAGSILCVRDDICHSQEGRILCPRTCDACEFRFLETDPEPPKEEQSMQEKADEDDSNTEQSMQEKADEDDSNTEQSMQEKADEDDSQNGNVAGECLKWHNTWRSKHKDTPSMTWDEELAKGAQEWAEKLVVKGSLAHASQEERKQAGENLAMAFMSHIPADYSPCKDGITRWYREAAKPGYDYTKPETSYGTGHFTQVVWRESTKLGCGVAKANKDGMEGYYVCCRYSPHGNMMGKYKENVMGLKDGLSFPKLLEEVGALKRHFKKMHGGIKKKITKIL